MSLNSRREYLAAMRERYVKARSKADKSRLLDEVTGTLGLNRKYAVQVLNHPASSEPHPGKRHRPIKYLAALPIAST